MCKIELKLFEPAGRLFLLILVLAVLVPALVGCGPAVYGRLENSNEVTEVFTGSQVLSNYQYYYHGFQRIPYAIIGIDKNYNLRVGHWKLIDLNPTLLNQLNYRMQHVYRVEPRGAWILDHDGNRLGIWYSSQNSTKVKLGKDNELVVVTPTPPDLSGIP